ncbi:MAG: enoyl-CoA hydratase/isomerase family protein [Candidatus Heimdallarchaeota archaeon]
MTVQISRDDSNIITLALNRPDKRNAINLQMINDLKIELYRIRDDPSVRCVIITGNGNSFCAGGDITEMDDRFGKALDTQIRLDTGFNEIVRTIRSIKRPVIAAVNGPCFGAGFVIATACDLIYASSTAKFGFAYGNIGLIPEASYFIARLVGLLKAKELVFFRKVINSQQSLSLGIVNQVFETEVFMEKIVNLAEELSQGPVKTIGLSKQLLNDAFENKLLSHLQQEALSQGAAFTSDEHKEGVAAFQKKRKANFRDL